MRTIQIPFDGFYHSITDSFLDREIELENEYRVEQGLDESYDYTIDFNGVAVKWSEVYKDWLKSEHGLDLPSLSFQSLINPREYNFTTDKIFCSISNDDTLTLYKWATNPENEHRLTQERIDSCFKSRDGFISFYGEFCEEWKNKPFLDWDELELGALFPELTGEDIFNIWENPSCNGFFIEVITWDDQENENI